MVTATNAAGAQTSQTISVTVTGVNDAPVATTPAELYNAVAGTDLTCEPLAFPSATRTGAQHRDRDLVGWRGHHHHCGRRQRRIRHHRQRYRHGNVLGYDRSDKRAAQFLSTVAITTTRLPSSSTTLTVTIDDNGNNGGSALSGSASTRIDIAPGLGYLDWSHVIDPYAATNEGTSATWIVPNSDGLTSTVFNGGGFTYDPTSHLPTGGGIGSISLVDNSTGNVLQTITGMSLSLGDFGNYIAREEAIESKIDWSCDPDGSNLAVELYFHRYSLCQHRRHLYRYHRHRICAVRIATLGNGDLG